MCFSSSSTRIFRPKVGQLDLAVSCVGSCSETDYTESTDIELSILMEEALAEELRLKLEPEVNILRAPAQSLLIL